MNAAVFLQRGPSERKQEQACLAYIDEQHWHMQHVVHYWHADAAVALVLNGGVDVIVAAFHRKELDTMAEDIGDRGQVVFVHPTPTVIRPPRRLPSIVEMVLRWRLRGQSTKEIAAELDADSTDVRAILRKHGQYPS